MSDNVNQMAEMKKRRDVFISITWFLTLSVVSASACAVEFNTDVLDAADKEHIDFSRFSQSGYIMPGQYQMQVLVNGQNISPSDFSVSFIEPDVTGNNKHPVPQACLSQEIIARMGLTESSLEKVTYWHNMQCADLSHLPGVNIRPDTAGGVLNINMPQAWLEYSDSSWLPPSRWDNGIPGVLLDYNLNGTVNRSRDGGQSHFLSYNGTTGANLGAWRLRADYQGSLSHTQDHRRSDDNRFTWERFYLFRALPRWRANLMLGENYISSDIFNAWRYTGVSMESDERMLPPKLRGYAPQISGIAGTNARVVISQQGRVLYDTMVPAGPFTVQDLDSSVRGRLDVEIIEQDGRKKTFQVNTSYVPYLTRPGQVRYKLVTGRSRDDNHALEGPFLVLLKHHGGSAMPGRCMVGVLWPEIITQWQQVLDVIWGSWELCLRMLRCPWPDFLIPVHCRVSHGD